MDDRSKVIAQLLATADPEDLTLICADLNALAAESPPGAAAFYRDTCALVAAHLALRAVDPLRAAPEPDGIGDLPPL